VRVTSADRVCVVYYFVCEIRITLDRTMSASTHIAQRRTAQSIRATLHTVLYYTHARAAARGLVLIDLSCVHLGRELNWIN